MDISTAISEGFAIYNRFHNNLNLGSKVNAAGLKTLSRIVDVENGDIIMGTLVDTVGMPWGNNKPFPKPTQIIENVYQNLINNTIVQAFSGFEHYLTNVIADLAHFSEPGRNTLFIHAHTDSEYKPTQPPEYSKCCISYAEQFAKNNVLSVRINELCDKLNIKDDIITNLLPLFEYFRNSRNCIAHLDGVVNKDFVESWENEELAKSINYWNMITRGKAPVLPEPIRGKKINFNITNSIMASAICFRISQLINKAAIALLGIKGFVHMAIYYSLFVEYHDYRSERISNSPEGAISNYLSNRYFVKKVSKQEVIDVAKELNLWKLSMTRFRLI